MPSERDLYADLAGVDPAQRDEIVASMLAAQEAAEFEVFEENWEAVQFFLMLSTQWRIGAMGGFLGLRYESIEAVLRLANVPIEKHYPLFLSIRIMELAALSKLNEKTS